MGYSVSRLPVKPVIDETNFCDISEANAKLLSERSIDSVHFACGNHLLTGRWVNVDYKGDFRESPLFMCADLLAKHPFPDNFFKYAFSQDFLEHLSQSESLIFLAEAFRTLQPGGVFRLSFPGLKGVLSRHFHAASYEGAMQGIYEAYRQWDHLHFYSQESLSDVAYHFGFKSVEFVMPNQSVHPALRDLDTRTSQQDLNVYAELIK